MLTEKAEFNSRKILSHNNVISVEELRTVPESTLVCRVCHACCFCFLFNYLSLSNFLWCHSTK